MRKKRWQQSRILHDQTCTKAKTVFSSQKMDDFNYELTPKLLFVCGRANKSDINMSVDENSDDRKVTLETRNIPLIIAAYLQLVVTLITLGTTALYTE